MYNVSNDCNDNKMNENLTYLSIDTILEASFSSVKLEFVKISTRIDANC
jgi:hypothetical protein